MRYQPGEQERSTYQYGVLRGVEIGTIIGALVALLLMLLVKQL